MRKVFVVNEPKGERLALGKFGNVVPLVPGWVMPDKVDGACGRVVEILGKQYQDGDFIVLGGHMKLNCIAFHWVLQQHHILRQLLPKNNGWFQITHDERGQDEWYISRRVRRKTEPPS